MDPTPITLGDELKVEYRDLLVQSGAEEVYLHYGFGPGDWRYVQEVPMAMEADGTWSATVQAGEAGRFSFCFRDSAGIGTITVAGTGATIHGVIGTNGP